MDQGWVAEEVPGRDQDLQEFTRDTGIQIKRLPAPESAREQLAMWRGLLATGASSPGVYGIDVIWPGLLNKDFIDLKPYFAHEISSFFPAMVDSYTVDSKLVAMPYHQNIGILYYRTDLLQEYGYRAPPKTWDELERMATRIQAGERAKGKKQFWGFVWQGAAAEALTCNALEWQASEGGGRIIEADKTISVNNPQTIRAWQRAARWVGSISPPSVVAYKEWDSVNVWVAGSAAFMHNWVSAYIVSQTIGSKIKGKFDVTVLPGGSGGEAGTLGGSGLAVSRFSAHPREAVELIRYLCRRDVQIRRSRVLFDPPSRLEPYENPDALKGDSFFALLNRAFRTGAVSRPSNVAGKKYDEVSSAYIKAVHSVLTGEKNAPEAAASLEGELVHITGFKTGPLPRGSLGPRRPIGASRR